MSGLRFDFSEILLTVKIDCVTDIRIAQKYQLLIVYFTWQNVALHRVIMGDSSDWSEPILSMLSDRDGAIIEKPVEFISTKQFEEYSKNHTILKNFHYDWWNTKL
ncbi:hypothetical protein A2V49_03425 [candidate division WWE3 bacterium RBG_19FT_COMBO_34_6]|uniref:Uncharacterized protein n=1 Tax=candidate division WWE3 bacterium RBG_19FT_COMBO_34_6 TaxID=1802612 RepID=A0A1F4UKX1_UNCKA|nr:MAG: hypothetical protein A2V49_03425 [candidate division WWE3 bacterium RBG_19FT_COMBO_34_6]